MNNQPSQQQANIEKAHAISTVWFLPFIAALLGAWILFQHLTHANVEIKIHFNNAESIIADKTKIRYKGVIVGSVKKIELDSSNGVNIIAEIESHATFMLRKKTKFWLVSPKASLTSISGLDTLFSGSYINLQPGGGEDSSSFTAISEQPISIPDNALLINLKSQTAGSVSVGTPLFFKKVKVGEVVRVRLDKSGNHVNIKAFVKKKYRQLIKKDSKFWNISGLTANISRTGVDLKLDSLTSLIAGGITFSSPQDSATITSHSDFELFASLAKSNTGVTIELTLNNINNLPKGAGILFKGLGIGRITNIQYSTEKQHFVAEALINQQFSDMLTSGAQFVLQKTSLSFSKIANIGNIISGDYISFVPATKITKNSTRLSQFVIQETENPDTSDLLLQLLTEDATGLNPGDPISYKGMKIGQISKLNFSDNGRYIEALINIHAPYRHLINKHSQFYLLNGINFKASLTGVKLQASPLENIISGGIGLYNAKAVQKSSNATASSLKQPFRLYPSKEMAKLGKNTFSKPLTVSLLSKELPAVSEGSPVYYHKLPIGEVSAFSIDDSGLMRTELNIKGEYKHLISKDSIFWNVSGFNIDAGLSGVKIQADSLLAIANGGIAVDIGVHNISNKYKNGLYKLFASYQQANQPPQKISIEFEQAGGLQVGSKLKLKGLVIGEITALNLDKNNKVQAIAELQAKFAKQIARKGSRFWIIRGELSLSGAKNLATLVSGVYLNVFPGKGSSSNKFNGEAKAPTIAQQRLGLPIILLADNAGSTAVGSPVYHRQIQIGEVLDKQLAADASGVEITVNIYPEYAHLIRQNSIFWPASGFNLDIGITGAVLKSTSLTSLLKGGISMSTTDKEALQPESDALARFKLKKEMNEAWLKWKLVIPKA